MSFELLTVPLLAAIAIFGAVVVLDARTVFLKEISVPQWLGWTGYSSDVFQEEIADAMLDIERAGRARAATRPLALESDDDSISLITEYFELTPLVRAFQQSGGFVAYAVDTYVTGAGDTYTVKLDISSRNGEETMLAVTHPKADMPGLIRKSAEAIMSVVEPEPLCASYLAAALEAGGGLDRAETCVREALPRAEPHDAIWLHNLAGVISFLKGDQVAAMARFQQALAQDRTFSPALLNVGVLLAMNGKPAEAVKAYDLLFRDLDDGVSDRTYAAAYAEWAKSLAALGRSEEAVGVLRQAITANPDYAESYTVLADLLPVGAEADRLRRRGERVAELNDQLYTENLVGKVFDEGKARLQPL